MQIYKKIRTTKIKLKVNTVHNTLIHKLKDQEEVLNLRRVIVKIRRVSFPPGLNIFQIVS